MGNNVSVPYSGYINGGINYNSNVIIVGMPLHHCKRFSINLCAGSTCDSDTIFHFNPRFDETQVVRNHKQGGSWGVEERNGCFPFQKGHNFELHLKLDQRGYKVNVNRKHFCTFNHRIPIERIQYLYIEGDVVITSIQYNQCDESPKTNSFRDATHASSNKPRPQFGKKFSKRAQPGNFPQPIGFAPPPYPGLPAQPPAYSGAGCYPSGPSPAPPFGGADCYQPALSYPNYPTPSSGPMYNPPIPLVTPIPGGLQCGKIIYINGTPKPNPARFSVNLACGAHDSTDIGLHFDVRFNYGSDRNVVVRTHRENNKYGPEERHQNYFPFYPDASFEMMILTEQNCFKVAVNNQHFTEFNHRIQPFQKVNYLNIVGDVQLSQVRLQ